MYKSLIVLLGCVAATLAYHEYEMVYRLPDSSETYSMMVKAFPSRKIITFEMDENSGFMESDSVQCYNTGFSATIVPAEESCYVSKLKSSFGDQILFLESHHQKVQELSDGGDVDAIELADETEVPEAILEFCGDYTVYKAIQTTDESRELSASDRHVQNKFYGRHRYMSCYRPYYYNYCSTVSIPTGTTVVFPWAFFG